MPRLWQQEVQALQERVLSLLLEWSLEDSPSAQRSARGYASSLARLARYVLKKPSQRARTFSGRPGAPSKPDSADA